MFFFNLNYKFTLLPLLLNRKKEKTTLNGFTYIRYSDSCGLRCFVSGKGDPIWTKTEEEIRSTPQDPMKYVLSPREHLLLGGSAFIISGGFSWFSPCSCCFRDTCPKYSEYGTKGTPKLLCLPCFC